MTQEPTPTFEDLKARVAELEANERETRWHLDRLAALGDPLEKIAVGIWEQVRARGLADRWGCYRLDGDRLVHVFQHSQLSPNPRDQAWLQAHRADAIPLDGAEQVAAAVIDDRAIAVADIVGEDGQRFPLTYDRIREREAETGAGLHSTIAVPLHSGGEVIGVFLVGRLDVRPFTDDDIAAIQPYADQMALAIGNARMAEQLEQRTAELADAVERERAAAGELRAQKIEAEWRLERLAAVENPRDKVILGIWEQIHAAGLADRRGTYVLQGDHLSPISLGTNWVDQDPEVARKVAPFARDRNLSELDRIEVHACLTRVPVVVNDVLGTGRDAFPGTTADVQVLADALSHTTHCMLAVPHIFGGEVVGVTNFHRVGGSRPFTDEDIAAIQPFADQIALAIGNARMAEQLEQRNAELAEALERQNATSEVLEVVGRPPGDARPVFEAILETGVRLSGATLGEIDLLDSDGEAFTVVAPATGPRLGQSFHIQEGTLSFPVRAGQVVNVFFEDFDAFARDWPASAADDRNLPGTGWLPPDPVMNLAHLSLPRLVQGRVVGRLMLIKRDAAGSFPQPVVELMQTFAAQAVIAIENARLFREQQEAVERLTATSEVLEIVSKSPTDITPVAQAIADRALHLFRAARVGVYLAVGDVLDRRGSAGERGLNQRSPISRGTTAGRALLEARAVRFSGLLRDYWEEYPGALERGQQELQEAQRDPVREAEFFVELGREHRSLIAVPMLSGDGAPGVILVGRGEEPFTDAEVALLDTFAAQAVIAIENARLFREQQEAVEQLTATSEVLEIVSKSPTDLQPVFDAVVEKGARICHGDMAILGPVEGAMFRPVASFNLQAWRERAGQPAPTRPVPWALSERRMASLAIREQRTVLFSGTIDEAKRLYPDGVAAMERVLPGQSAQATVPLIRNGEAIGVLQIHREADTPFRPAEVALLETFAAQAVIAIENARLFREQQEAVEQLTATAEVLEVIASSPTDLQPVLDTLVEKAATVCRGNRANLNLLEGDLLRQVATHNFPDGARLGTTYPLAERRSGARAVRERRTVEVYGRVEDIAEEYLDGMRAMTEAGHEFASAVSVPLIRRGEAIGMVQVHRNDESRFTAEEIGLLETFAAQAVIAIENARLFREQQEAVERLTATSEVLEIVSKSPTDITPVGHAIAEMVIELCGGMIAAVFVLDGDVLRAVGLVGGNTPAEVLLSRDNPSGRAMLDGETVRFSGTASELKREFPAIRDADAWKRVDPEQPVQLIVVRLLRDGVAIGVVSTWRVGERPFSAGEVTLLETFAAQAVIAIENARLFREQQEAVEQFTATAEVLEVIASSPTDLQPVLDTVVEKAALACHGDRANLSLVEGNLVRAAAGFNLEDASRLGTTYPMTERRQLTQSIRERRTLAAYGTVEELAREYPDGARVMRDSGRSFVSAITVPLLRGEEAIGAIQVHRTDQSQFTPNETTLLETFAAQAVMAIENARLFRELEATNGQLE